MALISTGRQIGQTLKSASRLRTIVGVFASHGFQNVAERMRLGRFILKRFIPDDGRMEQLEPSVRVRMAFEQLGPTFVKLGQLLATRPDLVPSEYVEEFKRLHDQVRPVGYDEIKAVLENQFGDLSKVFDRIDEAPLASASIAQVHFARLKDGSEVVIKVRRPGIVETINDDLGVLYTIAGLLEKYVPETRPWNPSSIVDEFFKTLDLETNFIVEANNIRRFTHNFRDEANIKIPKVHEDFSSEQVLVMEALQGTPLSKVDRNVLPLSTRQEIVRIGLRAFFKMVFRDRFFHGDLHAGNLFLLPDHRMGLIDFGVVGRLNQTVVSAIADMLVALAREDYDALAYAYVEIAPYSDAVDVDRFSRELRDMLAPYYGLTFKDVNTGKLLMDSTRLATRNGLRIPSELMLFFKSIVTVEGMGRLIIDDFDVLSYALEFAGDIVSAKYDPEKLTKDFAIVARDASSLLYALPRQLKSLLRKMNNNDHAWRIHIEHVDDLRRAIESSSNLIFLGLVVGSLIVGASITLHFQGSVQVGGVPVPTLICVVLAGVTSLAAFINYVRK